MPSGSRIRARIKLLEVEETPKGVRITSEATVVVEGAERPACIAELVAVVIPETTKQDPG